MLNRCLLGLAAGTIVVGLASAALAEPLVEANVCIYGGTSGGVAAALEAARLGKKVVLVEPGKHLGGMTAGGLSWVDIGDPRSVGGIARDYFTRLAAHDGKQLPWDRPLGAKGGASGAFAVEPHTAEALFQEMVREARVPVHLGARLAKVNKSGPRIAEIVSEGGTVFRARVFLDATYEGDLMAKAGVTYTLVREGNAKYGETYNGIHYAPTFRPRTEYKPPGPNGRMPGGQGVWDRDLPLDPYVVPGDPTSGLVPLVQPGEPGVEGEPAPGVQAYCFRLCLSTAADRLPIAPPPNYEPQRYELVARFIRQCQALGDDLDLRWFSKHDPLPNDKWDFNTATFGGNLPGASWEWPEASYARREQIARDHENYHRGLLHFLATDTRVPSKVRDEMRRFGLPRDEFIDHGGWPHQIYVREARRMVSDLVLTEHHTFGRQVAANSVGLGSYGTDTHEIRRIVKDGVVTREGKTAGGRGGAPPYPIGYGAIVPRAAECENLLVTFALSASHTAFSSIRMEPVFMVTSQSAAAAACLAIDRQVPVQNVPYALLRERLLAGGQVLEWPPAQAGAPKAETAQRDSRQAAPDAKPADVDGQSYDLAVVGGTPSGVACAVKAAREGCRVLLVQHNRHLGGMMTNGLMQWDALYGGHRAPLFSELLGHIDEHYRTTLGPNSPDYQRVRYSQEHYPTGWVEPHVAEREFNRLVAGESRITVLLEHYPTAADRSGELITGLTLCRFGGTETIHVRAAIYADATYEGDLLPLSKVAYRVGREGRDEYGEPHAGKIFTNIEHAQAPRDAVEGRLNIHPYSSRQGSIDPTSPATADPCIQAYNMRLCVTRDPANRILATEPPPGYNRGEFLHYERKSISTNPGPNLKSHMNSPILPGENWLYPEADWPTRAQITRRHLDFALGLIWFLQNDESVKPAKRAAFREWGLARDEFADNHYVPYEMYVREARRLAGRHVFAERDNSLAVGLGRTPLHADSVAVTDWYMDSHSCSTDSRPGFRYDGKLILTEESRPGQIPYRALLPRGVDNLLVPVCLSATHVAWGAVRLEPVWMQTGEAAGLAAALAVREKAVPGKLDPELLLRALVERRHLVSFFNDVDAADGAPATQAAQYFGTKGFFHDYNARLGEPLKEATGRLWAQGLAKLEPAGQLDANELARSVAQAEAATGPAMSASLFAMLLPKPVKAHQAANPAAITRGEALRWMWELKP